jgi:excisionase family DNA binding protein
MSTMPEKAAFSVEEACTYIGTSRPTVYRLMDSGAIPSFHIGRRRLILKEDLDRFIQEQKAMAGI